MVQWVYAEEEKKLLLYITLVHTLDLLAGLGYWI